MSADEQKPVAAGLLALLAVGLVVGLILGLGALAGSLAFGLGGGSSDSEGQSTSSERLVIPSFTTGADKSDGAEAETPAKKKDPAEEEGSGIQLAASPTTVGSMDRIDLTGTYEGGDGAILEVQRRNSGKDWTGFGVSATVSGGGFSTYVMTGQEGKNEFRLVDSSTGKASNVVTVQITG